MENTKIEELWNCPCQAYHLQFLPDDETIRHLCYIQDLVEDRVITPLLRLPAASLHMTVVSVFSAVVQFDRQKDDIWNERVIDWQPVFKQLIEDNPRFTLNFSTVHASDAAITVQADEPVELHELRRKIVETVDYKGWHPTSPRIAHMTLFRYPVIAPIPTLWPLLNEAAAFDITVDRITLVREMKNPSLQTEVIMQTQLSSL